MNIFESVILGAVQGVTEFLPISSSGHLVIVEKLMGLNAQSLLEFDIIMHLGTLFSILVFFRKEIFELIKLLPKWFLAVFLFFRSGFKDKTFLDDQLHTITALFIATIPAGVFGVFFGDFIETAFRSYKTVGLMMLSTSLVFVLAERIYKRKSLFQEEAIDSFCHNGICRIVFIGLMQALALIPGVSRSGSTISAGLITGMKRDEAAKFSFFLGSIAIFGAFVLTIKDFSTTSENFPGTLTLLAGFISSFLFGILAIGFLMKFLKKHPLSYFSIYLVVVSGILLFVL
ncbi:MAG: undecaprenyl-diphosphate phosphatase [Candidatus Gracilibacteria bacterium]|jgi:undecaprenyl-diphosphatase|nr:undecaprenyl-diphosphate phosphatase [Candidatus Gracilibacteria bacterium]